MRPAPSIWLARISSRVFRAFNPANGFLYVTNLGNGTPTVTVYDQNGNQQSTTGFAGLQQPEGITVVP